MTAPANCYLSDLEVIVSIIIIKTDKNSPNHTALEAVMSWMLNNYHERNYKKERTIKTKNGMELKVKEMAHRDKSSVCSATFKVTRVDRERLIQRCRQ